MALLFRVEPANYLVDIVAIDIAKDRRRSSSSEQAGGRPRLANDHLRTVVVIVFL